MALTVGSIVLKDASGNVVLVRSLTDADITQLKEDHTKLLALSGQIDAMENGGRQLAYKDYTQSANQGEMQPGTYYMVPFNAANQFLEFDPATGKPKADQADITDHIVAYYKLMYKGTGDSGAVAELGKMEVKLNFDYLEEAIAGKAALKHLDAAPVDGSEIQANEIGFFTAQNAIVTG